MTIVQEGGRLVEEENIPSLSKGGSDEDSTLRARA